MSVYVESRGQGEKVVFIHGAGWSGRMWQHQRDYLQRSMEVLLVDLPGHGRSPGDGCTSVEAYGDAVFGALQEMGARKCYVAGHSMGGAIAISLALAHPDVVKGLILIGSGAKLRVLPAILEGIRREKEKTVRMIVDIAFSPKTPAALKEADFEETMACSAETIYRDFSACDRFNAMDTVGSIKAPTLILSGGDDVLTPPKYAGYLQARIEGSTVVIIEDAGHMVMLEKPEEVSRAIEGFVSGG